VTVYLAKDRRARGADGKPQAKAYRYDFQYRGRRYVSPRTFPTKAEAEAAEAERRRQLRRAAAGLEVSEGQLTPRIADWAEVYFAFLQARGRVLDLRSIEHVLRVVLRFWGRKPDRPLKPHERGPFHDLRLADPITDPRYLLAFEDWMLQRRVAGTTRNHYRTAMSRLYAIAMLPQYRAQTRVTMNPFLGLMRDRVRRRTVTITLEQLRAILREAAPHLRLAIAIGALAPKLRLANILGLQWGHIAPDFSTIVVDEHKTRGQTGQPLVATVSPQLQDILRAAHAGRAAGVAHVIHYHGRGLRKTIEVGLRLACGAAGVPYGRDTGGVTFHTLRHMAATMMAAMGIAEGLRKEAMGHLSLSTTQWYTHLAPEHERAALEQLSQALPIRDLLVGTAVEVDGQTVPLRRAQTPRQAKR
jgi:integrase